MTSTNGFLRVPLRLQALCLGAKQNVVRAMADYRLLPAETSGKRQLRSPNLSDRILTPPFTQDQELPPGIHLHWLMPDALTQGEQDGDFTRFPYVPNRWLILRSGGGQPEKQWVVESDYLYPAGDGDFGSEAEAPVNVQVLPDPAPASGYRYRFLGRALSLEDWRKAQSDSGREYLPALTCVGQETAVRVLDPVRASFASFYPNCRTVFGLHDGDSALHTGTPPAGLRYDVLGWYSDVQRDCLTALLTEATTPEALQALLEERFEWGWTASSLPRATLFHARLSFGAGSRSLRTLSKPLLAVGTTETEALAAHLAHTHSPQSPESRRTIEEQLETLQLADRLEGHTLDIDDRLQEARHERGFASVQGGLRWAIQPQSDTTTDVFAQFRRSKPRARRTPPPAWTTLLDALNSLQEEYQRATDTLEDLRQRLYFRWWELLPSKGANTNFYKSYVVPVRHQLTSMGQLSLEQDSQTGEWRILPQPSRFEVVSRQHTWLSDYLRIINTPGVSLTSKTGRPTPYETWGIEFENCCGFVLQSNHTVTIKQQDQSWEIKYQDVTYPVRAEDSGLFLEIPPAATSLAVRLAAALDAAQSAVRAYNATEEGAVAPYVLRPEPEAPYFTPAEPVVLLTGEAAAADLWREETEDLLPCEQAALTLDLGTLPAATLTALTGYLNGLGPEAGRTWTQPPWNPFLMHWNAHVAPCGRADNGDFNSELLLKHYQLDLKAVDQRLKPGEESAISDTDDTYQGISLLSPSAGPQVGQRILRWLESSLLPDYYEAKKIPEEQQVEGYLEAHFDEVHAWFSEKNPNADVKDPIFTSLWSYAKLQQTPCLAQSLGNLNEALLLRESTLQLKVSDPTALANSVHYYITETVRDALGDSMQRRPLFLDRFNPLRAGALTLNGLWLVDTFGQAQEVIPLDKPDSVAVVTTTDQTPPSALHHVLLPPRLVQPARLRFEWLPATEGNGQRSNEQPGTNPICGFVLVNNLEGSLEVYDAQGKALGEVDRGKIWRTAPETGTAVRMDARSRPQLSNPHLQRVVDHVLDQDADFLERFLSTQRTALETIDPEAFAENPSRALLVSRPMAVVRASMRLELQGPAAFDPTAMQEGGGVTDRGLSQLQIPVRLGEYQQLDDGLVGFWLETDEGAYADDGIFYSPQLKGREHPRLRTYKDGETALRFTEKPLGPERRMTMLLDPRGQVHATTGVLPSPQLRLHPEHYSRALGEMEVNFLTAPFLSDQGALRLPVPEEPGYLWSWVAQDDQGQWSQTTKLSPPNPRASFSAPQELREGWLILRKDKSSDT
ncbi:hypothetical protein [Hyalangium versicolor]|uniref:hypothetical protein n=1 Tax=Hyalangium versicolor TaxID=2861190 RepID=UPI001CC8F5E9|nr:hypothetical protein [Hyalangium versicolor]